jgi:hypothetical protein
MAVISRPKGAEVVVMKERYRADGAGGYSATPSGAATLADIFGQ